MNACVGIAESVHDYTCYERSEALYTRIVSKMKWSNIQLVFGGNREPSFKSMVEKDIKRFAKQLGSVQQAFGETLSEFQQRIRLSVNSIDVLQGTSHPERLYFNDLVATVVDEGFQLQVDCTERVVALVKSATEAIQLRIRGKQNATPNEVAHVDRLMNDRLDDIDSFAANLLQLIRNRIATCANLPQPAPRKVLFGPSVLDPAQPNSVSEADAKAHLAAAEQMHAREEKTEWVSTIRATFAPSELLSAMIARIQYRNDPIVLQQVERWRGSLKEKERVLDEAENDPKLRPFIAAYTEETMIDVAAVVAQRTADELSKKQGVIKNTDLSIYQREQWSLGRMIDTRKAREELLAKNAAVAAADEAKKTEKYAVLQAKNEGRQAAAIAKGNQLKLIRDRNGFEAAVHAVTDSQLLTDILTSWGLKPPKVKSQFMPEGQKDKPPTKLAKVAAAMYCWDQNFN